MIAGWPGESRHVGIEHRIVVVHVVARVIDTFLVDVRVAGLREFVHNPYDAQMLLGAECPAESRREAWPSRLVRFVDVLREHDRRRRSVANVAQSRCGRFHFMPCILDTDSEEHPVGGRVAHIRSDQKPAVPIRCTGVHAVGQRAGTSGTACASLSDGQMNTSIGRISGSRFVVDDLIPDVLPLDLRQAAWSPN